MPLRPGAEVRVAHRFFRALLILGIQSERPQVQGLAVHPGHSLQRALPLGGAGGEVIHLPGKPLAQSLQRREQGRHTFSRAGGHAGKQPTLQADGRVHLNRHVPLPGTVTVVGEVQRGQRGIPRPSVATQKPHPADVRQQQAVEPLPALRRRQQRVELPVHVALAVHIRHPDHHLAETLLLAKHVPVAHRLGLMSRIGHQGRLLALPQLDLLDHRHIPVAEGIHAPGDVQLRVLFLHRNANGQRHFALPAVPQQGLPRLVAQHAVLHVLQRPTQTQDIVAMEGKLHQRTHRHTNALHADSPPSLLHPPRRGASVMRRDPSSEITPRHSPQKGFLRVEDP